MKANDRNRVVVNVERVRLATRVKCNDLDDDNADDQPFTKITYLINQALTRNPSLTPASECLHGDDRSLLRRA
jgi:hypothetical protein